MPLQKADKLKGLGFDFDKEPYEVLAPIWVDLYKQNAEQAGLCDGVVETMQKAERMGICQIVLSACEITMLERYLEKLGVHKYLSSVMGLDNIHARSKLELARAWREKHPQARALMIGDTTHDYDTARILGADCILYAGGHQSRAKLEACGCPVVDSISEVQKYL